MVSNEMALPRQPSGNRPFGVTAIIFLKVLSLLQLLGDILGISFADLPAQISAVRAGNFADTILNYDNIILLITGVVMIGWFLTLIIGLWRLKRWAWFITMIQLGISMGLCLWAYLQGVPLYGYMVLNTIMVFYLNQREIQQAFGSRVRAKYEG